MFFSLVHNNQKYEPTNINDYDRFMIVSFDIKNQGNYGITVNIDGELVENQFIIGERKYKISGSGKQLKLDHITIDNTLNCFYVKNID